MVETQTWVVLTVAVALATVIVVVAAVVALLSVVVVVESTTTLRAIVSESATVLTRALIVVATSDGVDVGYIVVVRLLRVRSHLGRYSTRR